MSKIRNAAAAILLCAGLSTPAVAAETTTTTTTTTNSSATAAVRANAQPQAAAPICVRTTLNVSLIQRDVCRTRAEWERAGGVPTDER